MTFIKYWHDFNKNSTVINHTSTRLQPFSTWLQQDFNRAVEFLSCRWSLIIEVMSITFEVLSNGWKPLKSCWSMVNNCWILVVVVTSITVWCLVVEVIWSYRGGKQLVPQGPGYPGQLVRGGVPGKNLRMQLVFLRLSAEQGHNLV